MISSAVFFTSSDSHNEADVCGANSRTWADA